MSGVHVCTSHSWRAEYAHMLGVCGFRVTFSPVPEDKLSAEDAIAADLPPQMFSASGAYAPGEKPYVALSSGPCATPAVAIERWMDRLMAFVSDNPGDVLWWRARPTVDGEVDCETGEPVWRAYARLAMGNME